MCHLINQTQLTFVISMVKKPTNLVSGMHSFVAPAKVAAVPVKVLLLLLSCRMHVILR